MNVTYTAKKKCVNTYTLTYFYDLLLAFVNEMFVNGLRKIKEKINNNSVLSIFEYRIMEKSNLHVKVYFHQKNMLCSNNSLMNL